MEFLQSVTALTAARIIGKERSRILVAHRADEAWSCDHIVDHDGDANLLMHKGIELEVAFAKDGILCERDCSARRPKKKLLCGMAAVELVEGKSSRRTVIGLAASVRNGVEKGEVKNAPS